mgnify:CR=1 FL=1
MPKFSIIIPVYNAEKYLRQCLDSVLAQTERDWECVCIDDGSTDGSAAILDEYAAKDRRFYIVHKRNEGVAVARNVGLDLARGEWITWLDADDEYAPWRLEEARRIIEREDPDIVRFRTRFIDDGFLFNQELIRTDERIVFDGDDAKIWCWDVLMPGGMMWTFVAKKALFDGNRFVPGMRVKEEFPVCARIATRVGRVVQSEAEAYTYRQIDSSAMHSKRTSGECISFIDMVRGLMEEACFKEDQKRQPVYEAMRRRVRMHCECDIIDWVRMRDRSDHGQREIYAAYQRLRESGLFNCSTIQQFRYRIPMWWWNLTGQIGLIKIMISIENAVRRIKE